MKAKKWGRVINTASAHSIVASPFKSAYVAANMASRASPSDRSRNATSGITVNGISPGYVWTPLVEQQIPDTMKARGLTREQVMNDVLLAASADQAVRHGRASRGIRSVSVQQGGRLDHRREPQHGRRLDRRLGYRCAPVSSSPPSLPAHRAA